MRNEEAIKTLKKVEEELRARPDASYHEVKAAQSASQARASLEDDAAVRAATPEQPEQPEGGA